MKNFIQLVIQMKSDDDFRSFVICEDANGDMWELRGYGKTVEEAVQCGLTRFRDEFWDCYGYKI